MHPARPTLMFRTVAGKKILGAIDDSGKLDTCLPPIISSREPVGFISDNIAKSFNLSSGVVVSSGEETT